MILLDLKALHKICYGVYVITSGIENKCNGQIANTVVQVASQPALVMVSINKQNYTHKFIKQNGIYAVSILSVDAPISFIGKFGFRSGKDFDKFEETDYIIGTTGTRIVTDYAVAYFEVKVTKTIDAKTHTVFMGEVVNSKLLNEKPPMTYEYYHQVKGGKTPKAAPTFIQPKNEEKNTDSAKYECKICGYIYNPIDGDPESNIPPGTPFEKLPEDWICPICGASKTNFFLKN